MQQADRPVTAAPISAATLMAEPDSWQQHVAVSTITTSTVPQTDLPEAAASSARYASEHQGDQTGLSSMHVRDESARIGRPTWVQFSEGVTDLQMPLPQVSSRAQLHLPPFKFLAI